MAISALKYKDPNTGQWKSIAAIKGETGATGATGPQGPQGESGVYYGTDTPPAGTKVWIDPSGTADQLPEEGDGYIKYPNGTLICWGHAGTGVGVSQSSFGALWAVTYTINYTFPVPFIDYPCISGSNRGGIGIVCEIDYTPTQLQKVVLARQTNAKVYVSFYWTAIGRWK